MALLHDELMPLYERHTACFWTPDNIDLSGDLEEGDKNFVEQVLGFFSWADGLVDVDEFLSDVPEEARMFFHFAISASSGIHAETYALLIERCIPPERMLKVHSSLEHCDAVVKKANWMQCSMDPSRPIHERIVTFACIESLMFAGVFACIWLSDVRMSGLLLSNELIARDKSLHCEFACKLYRSTLKDECAVHQIVREAVSVETAFVTEALPLVLIANSSRVGDYIKYVADNVLRGLGHSPVYGVVNPFDMTSLQGNFFF